MPGTMKFPRTISRGPLKGRTFETWGAYSKALNSLREARDEVGAPALPGPESVFEVFVKSGTFEMKMTGDPRDRAQVKQAGSMLASLTDGRHSNKGGKNGSTGKRQAGSSAQAS